jgi:hypothetical protein
MKFLTNEPALLIGKTLIIADLHLGVEYEYSKAGMKIPSQTKKIEKRIEELIEKTNAKNLIIIGDIKHKVPGMTFQEKREIPDFFKTLSEKISVGIVPGNHDAEISKILSNVKIYPSSGLLLKNTYLTHGHKWPKQDFLKAEFLVISHNHPLIEFKDKLGYRWLEKVWIRSKLKPSSIRKKYKNFKKLPELIVMPTFSDLVGGFAMNRHEKEPLGPILKCADLEKAKVYLLDGTFLGKLEGL